MFIKKTKWMPLGNYSFDGTDYIVFVRANLKSGMMDFKVKRVQAFVLFSNKILPSEMIDTKEQWAKITNLIK